MILFMTFSSLRRGVEPDVLLRLSDATLAVEVGPLGEEKRFLHVVSQEALPLTRDAVVFADRRLFAFDPYESFMHLHEFVAAVQDLDVRLRDHEFRLHERFDDHECDRVDRVDESSALTKQDEPLKVAFGLENGVPRVDRDDDHRFDRRGRCLDRLVGRGSAHTESDFSMLIPGLHQCLTFFVPLSEGDRPSAQQGKTFIAVRRSDPVQKRSGFWDENNV